MNDELLHQARRDYGDLITKITIWPPGLGIDVHLIGGAIVQYQPSGKSYPVDQPSQRTKAGRWIASAGGMVRRLMSRP